MTQAAQATGKVLSMYERRLERGLKGLTVYLKPNDIKDLKVLAALKGNTLGELIVELKDQALHKREIQAKPKRAASSR